MTLAQPSLFELTGKACAVGGCGAQAQRESFGFWLCEKHTRTIEAQGGGAKFHADYVEAAENGRDILGRSPLPPHNGTETSKAAAVAIAPVAGTLRAKVLDFIEGRGIVGATQEEIHFATGMRISTICGRCRELTLAGKVRDSGERRANTSGNAAVVWVSA